LQKPLCKTVMNVRIEPSWNRVLAAEWEAPYFKLLTDFVRQEYMSRQVFPPGRQIFAAFDAAPFDQVKVVILGQDPYHGVGQANGLCFSVNEGVPMPPSLVNIFKEVHDDVGAPIPASGDLSRWARQGVLLLNATLTVQAHQPQSHQGKGWEVFTDHVIARLAEEREHLVFMLWGAYAKRKGAFIDHTRHLVLTAAHPSPLSANKGGFFGCRHFSRANDYLVQHGLAPIEW
jgi:uracil-DNA glycosylase